MVGHVAIVGVGAIGGYFGAHLAHAGIDLTLVDAWPRNVEAIRAEGLRVEGMSARDELTAVADIRHIGEVQSLLRKPPIDILFVAVKSYDTVWATQLMMPYLSLNGTVVSLQNSMNEATIAGIAGASRTCGCAIVSLACDMIAPGVVRRMSPNGRVIVGAEDPRARGITAAVARTLSHVEESETTEDIVGIKWSKLVINSMRNGLSAMTGLSGLRRDTMPATMKLGMALGAQAIQVGRASGYELVDTAYAFDQLVGAGEGDRGAIAEIAARMREIAEGRSDEQYPSMAQDIRKGRRTETDAINGLIAERGRALGINASAHGVVHDMLLEIERGRLTPSPKLAEHALAMFEGHGAGPSP